MEDMSGVEGYMCVPGGGGGQVDLSCVEETACDQLSRCVRCGGDNVCAQLMEMCQVWRRELFDQLM